MNSVRHVVIHGRVQGVGYRAFVEDEAIRRGIAGFVRNRRDGTVEALFQGEPTVIADMVAVCREGPPGARVDRINERDGDGGLSEWRDQPVRFAVLPTV